MECKYLVLGALCIAVKIYEDVNGIVVNELRCIAG
jgi:hypothetical protein